tara:strand:+ start:1579 stop:1833 length:255 start_codon:yes stop_codon:yes gene_type:complete
MWHIYKKILANELFKMSNRYAKSETMNENIYFITEEKNGTYTVNIKNTNLFMSYKNFMNKEEAELGLKMLLELLGYEEDKRTVH